MRQIGPEARRLVFTNLDHPTEGLAARMQVKDGYDPVRNPHPYENSQPASADPTLNTPNLLAERLPKCKATGRKLRGSVRSWA